jgi:Na+-translocating ferredoxin:NAD+ oxidoreductase subunit G
MSATETKTLVPLEAGPSSARLVLTLALIAMLSGLLIVLTFQFTAARIAANQQAALERAVGSVLPEVVSRRYFLLDGEGLNPLPATESARANVIAGYDAEGRLTGLALEGAARGYQDVVRVLYGYDPRREVVIGMTVLQSTETPGLGDKVETDPVFLANFVALDARLDARGTALANEIRTVKSGTKTAPWQIDGISGATVTSVAVGNAIRTSTNEMLPLLARYRDGLPLTIEPGT